VADEQQVHCNGGLAFSVMENGAWSHRREPLLRALQKLEQAALNATNDEDRSDYTIATILCAYASSEAFLHEWAKANAPSIYTEIAGRPCGLLRVAEEVLPEIGANLPADLIELANVKNALCNPRAAPVEPNVEGTWHPSAQRAAGVAKVLYAQCFGASPTS
jgi:hypothetical protein